tara:strand:- start:164 stop:391 length:228 start_codon:yes stop_codon:yes gene_type:complete
MQRNYFHNYKDLYENKTKKKLNLISRTEVKSVVDINILLNRVREEEKNETKRIIIFFSVIILAVGLLGTLISIIK